MFSEEQLYQAGQKQKIIGVKSFWVKYNYRFEFTKKCISKFFIKMFLKKQSRKAPSLVNASEF